MFKTNERAVDCTQEENLSGKTSRVNFQHEIREIIRDVREWLHGRNGEILFSHFRITREEEFRV